MALPTIDIDGSNLRVAPGSTILASARTAGIYIPTLCAHTFIQPVEEARGSSFVFRGTERLESDDPESSWGGCGICAVEANGEILRACSTRVTSGMVVRTGTERVTSFRRGRLFQILEDHPHACLTCSQAEGCPRTLCSNGVPEDERCCELLGSCELEKVSRFVGVPPDLPRYRPRGLPSFTGEPLFDVNTELCISCLRCVRACGEVRGVGALSFVIAHDRPLVGTSVGPTRTESHCRFCGACVEVCPTSALLDKERAIGDAREHSLVPCRHACPAGIDIPRMLRYIARGELGQAKAVIKEKCPLTFSVSYACYHPCEEACRRGDINEPISVCRLKRFVVDSDGHGRESPGSPPPATGKDIAIVGSGPAGLTAAYFCARKGHKVTIYEASSEPGGMLLFGIPEYRLPRSLLERDIAEVRGAGVEFRCNTPIDAGELERLATHSDAVFVAAGAHEAKRIDIPGIRLAGVHRGIDFLRAHALRRFAEDYFEDQEVIVVGGGNVAVDAARVARRLGPREVCIVSLESTGDLPAWQWEVDEALEEGIRFLPNWGPREVRGISGRVAGLALERCTRVFDDKGGFDPQFDDTETLELPADAVILAIGQIPSSGPFSACGLSEDGTIEIDEKTLMTKMPKVYAGGDIASGPMSLIHAVAMGRKAAERIDESLGGGGDMGERFLPEEPAVHFLGRVDNFAAKTRNSPAMVEPSERGTSFCLLEATFTPDAAREEASRCLSCDLRLSIPPSILPPQQDLYLEFSGISIERVPETEGVYQLFDEGMEILAIRGVMNLKEALLEEFSGNAPVRFFAFEEDPMYTKRESELVQKYLQTHGRLPGGATDDLDDLF